MDTTVCELLSLTGKQIKVVVGAHDQDPISEELRNNSLGILPAFQLLMSMVTPGDRLIDLGAHIGTLSLVCAGEGCQVLSVEASQHNVELLRAGVAINGFDEQMHVVHSAVGDHSGTLRFIENGPWGMVADPGSEVGREVPVITGDQLLEKVQWNNAEFVKIDVEGSEIPALLGMRRILECEDAPVLVYESNGHTLNLFGFSPEQLLQTVEGFGYRNYLVEPNRLVPVSVGDLQPECFVDYLALKRRHKVPPGWIESEPVSTTAIVEKTLAACKHVSAHHRAYIARSLARHKEIADDSRIQSALDLLHNDPDPEVRKAIAWRDSAN